MFLKERNRIFDFHCVYLNGAILCKDKNNKRDPG